MRAFQRGVACLFAVTIAACAPLDAHRGEAQTGEPPDGNAILVMLRAAPSHFRADADYAGGYGSSFGREARRRIARAIADQYGLRLLDSWPMPALGVDCFVMEGASSDVELRSAERALGADPRVESVQVMQMFHVLAHNDPLYSLQPSARVWHLAELHHVTTGKNVRVATIDTAVQIDHPDLQGQIYVSRDFVGGRLALAEIHGTAIAGIIAARADNGIGIAGVAPEAKLLALRACWESGQPDGTAVCNSFTLAKALQFALDQDAQVINLSLTGPPDRLLERLLDVALARRISVVAAVDASARDGGFPASHRGVAAVAGEESRELMSGVMQAPGRDIPTTVPIAAWRFVSGSSFAAAHVTGIIALLRELAPAQGLDQIRAALVPDPSAGSHVDYPVMIDACAAVTRTTGHCVCDCTMAQGAKGPSRH